MGIVALTMYENNNTSSISCEAGATGYLLKDSESRKSSQPSGRSIGRIAHPPVSRQ